MTLHAQTRPTQLGYGLTPGNTARGMFPCSGSRSTGKRERRYKDGFGFPWRESSYP
jgi:hypothetical protein